MWPFVSQFLDRHPTATGLVGIASSAGASTVTIWPDLEIAIRVAGGVLGLAIGCVTLAIQIRNLRLRK